MIPHDKDLLPLEAAPYFVKLLSVYNQGLEDLIGVFKVQQNEKAFTKVLDYFVSDYEYYQANFEYWQKEAKTEGDRVSLEILRPLLEESGHLIAKAIGLIGH